MFIINQHSYVTNKNMNCTIDFIREYVALLRDISARGCNKDDTYSNDLKKLIHDHIINNFSDFYDILSGNSDTLGIKIYEHMTKINVNIRIPNEDIEALRNVLLKSFEAMYSKCTYNFSVTLDNSTDDNIDDLVNDINDAISSAVDTIGLDIRSMSECVSNDNFENFDMFRDQLSSSIATTIGPRIYKNSTVTKYVSITTNMPFDAAENYIANEFGTTDVIFINDMIDAPIKMLVFDPPNFSLDFPKLVYVSSGISVLYEHLGM